MPAPFINRKHRRTRPTTTARRNAGRVALDVRGLARRDATAIVYTPDPDYVAIADSAIRSGVRKDAPCIIISSVDRPEQQIFTTTLRHLASVAGLPVPAIVIIRDSVPAPEQELVAQYCRQIVAGVDRNDLADNLDQSSGELS